MLTDEAYEHARAYDAREEEPSLQEPTLQVRQPFHHDEPNTHCLRSCLHFVRNYQNSTRTNHSNSTRRTNHSNSMCIPDTELQWFPEANRHCNQASCRSNRRMCHWSSYRLSNMPLQPLCRCTPPCRAEEDRPTLVQQRPRCSRREVQK